MERGHALLEEWLFLLVCSLQVSEMSTRPSQQLACAGLSVQVSVPETKPAISLRASCPLMNHFFAFLLLVLNIGMIQ